MLLRGTATLRRGERETGHSDRSESAQAVMLSRQGPLDTVLAGRGDRLARLGHGFIHHCRNPVSCTRTQP